MGTTRPDLMPGGQPKRERYDWRTTDQPGEFAMIDKADLDVDQDYQRRHSQHKILKMAAEWSWVACGALSVALRQEDSRWYVMDGQHRLLAARHRDDIRQLPCMVFGVVEVAQEASGFLRANTNRKTMTMVDRFKAALMTEDRAARVVNELVLSSGRHVAAGGGQAAFSAVGVLLRCVREDEAATRRVWPILVEICDGKKINQNLISGLWYLERHLEGGTSLASNHWRRRLVQVGYDSLMRSIDSAAAFHGSGKGFKVCAIGVVQAVNKGLRNLLPHTINVGDASEEA